LRNAASAIGLKSGHPGLRFYANMVDMLTASKGALAQDMPSAVGAGRESEMPNSNAPWTVNAAYLYVLHLDGPSLAWEYLRRNPAYQEEWRQCSERDSVKASESWGLQFR
jgi:hypothetical protein